MVYQFHAVRYILLYTVGHGHAYHAVNPQRLGAQGSNHTAVLASRYTDYGITALTVNFKPVPDPPDHLILNLFGIKCFHKYYISKGTDPFHGICPFIITLKDYSSSRGFMLV